MSDIRTLAVHLENIDKRTTRVEKRMDSMEAWQAEHNVLFNLWVERANDRDTRLKNIEANIRQGVQVFIRGVFIAVGAIIMILIKKRLQDMKESNKNGAQE